VEAGYTLDEGLIKRARKRIKRGDVVKEGTVNEGWKHYEEIIKLLMRFFSPKI